MRMAERLNKRQIDSARELIRAQRYIQELDRHIVGDREMSATQIRAAEILLKKSVPDLSSITLETGPEGITIQWKS